MEPASWVYLNGSFCRADAAVISPFDRGFLFAQSAYEVTAVFNGRLIDFDGHVARLQRTLSAIEIESDWDSAMLEALHGDLVRRNRLEEGMIYLQVSAGSYGGRDFTGPETLHPHLFMFSEERKLIGPSAQTGISAVLVEDQRWKRRDFKTTQLLSQVLAYREAARAGANTAIFHEDGEVTETASANLWAVMPDRTIVTRDLGQHILAGITRQTTLRLAAQEGLDVQERPVTLKELSAASEIFTTSATGLVLPVVQVNGKPVGAGRPGSVTRLMQALYYRAIGADIGERAIWLTGVEGPASGKY